MFYFSRCAVSRIKRILPPVVVFLGLVAGIFLVKSRPSYKWYETVTMYHVFVKSFYDTDGDGKGDLKGLTQKLDYIKALGVNTIHPLPLTPALNVDSMPRSHYGYEITDFKNIHPDYGTLEDFKTFVKEAHKRGLHIVNDFITTVISVQHPFFQDVLNNPDSRYKKWFITADEIPEGDWMNFNDYSEHFKSKAWKPLPHGGYYYSLWGNSPFLDYHNPEVREYILSVFDFWLDLGIDGFRIDATKHLYINGPGEHNQYHQPENFEFWKLVRRHITEKYGPDKILIAETVPIPENYAYVVPKREMFDIMFDSTFINDFYPYHETKVNELYVASFLHSFFDNPAIYKSTGLHDRLMYHSDHDGARLATRLSFPTEKQLKLAGSVLILTPAHLKIYAGDEIGIKGFTPFSAGKDKWFHATLASMAWNNTKNGGFTTSGRAVVPITDDYLFWNVRDQESQPDSLLQHYRALIALKNKYPEYFFKGERTSLPVDDNKLYAYFLTGAKGSVFVLMNLSSETKQFKADHKAFAESRRIKKLFGETSFSVKNQTFETGTLEPYGTYVFELKGAGEELFKSDDPKRASITDIKPGTATTAQKNKILLLNDPADTALTLSEKQGKVPVRLYELTKDGNYILRFSANVSTDEGDVVLPVRTPVNALRIESEKPVRIAYERQKPASVFKDKVRRVVSTPKNVSLQDFSVGRDQNFLYFKMKKGDYALVKNGGLDFIILLAKDEESSGSEEPLSFWHLPPVHTQKKTTALLLYERHIKSGHFQTDIAPSRPFGVTNAPSSMIFETIDSFYALADLSVLPKGKLFAAPFVWSAGGVWGDRPPEGKPVPIVERITPFPNKNYQENSVRDYLEIP